MPRSAARRGRGHLGTGLRALALSGGLWARAALGAHHMMQTPAGLAGRAAGSLPLRITNQCSETLYPAIQTQAGTAPATQGFPLAAGATMNLTVGTTWQGRVWARTNCSFNAAGNGAANTGPNGGGVACTTGDCGGVVDCKGTGAVPATLAEFTLGSGSGQAFYDISLVDGYNVPVGIVALFAQSGNASLADIPPNLTNPACIATAGLLAPAAASGSQLVLGANASFPLPLERSQSDGSVARWCPWDLQLDPPLKPGAGVYPYPDDSIQRPAFDPCVSACARSNSPQDCCTGAYGSPGTCQPSYYSTQAKAVCPDAYSYAFDDQTSTFIVPSGGGFAVVFCPPGRSTNILATMGDELRQLAQTGRVSARQLAMLGNASYIDQLSGPAARAAAEPAAWAAAAAAALLALPW